MFETWQEFYQKNKNINENINNLWFKYNNTLYENIHHRNNSSGKKINTEIKPENAVVGDYFIWNGLEYGVVQGANGTLWLDRNLGATRVATSSTDSEAYGDLYQWGRLTDGHEKRTSGTTPTLSTSDVPGHGDFITNPSSPYDWRSPQNNNLWQGVNGINNPCPPGWRLPTIAEWQAERLSWSTNNSAGAYNSALKLPVGGYRYYEDGSIYVVGSYGYYWSSLVSGIYAQFLYFRSSSAGSGNYWNRASGSSVRPIKDY